MVIWFAMCNQYLSLLQVWVRISLIKFVNYLRRSMVSFKCTYSIKKNINDTVHWVNSWARAKPIVKDRDNWEQRNCQVISTSFCVILFYIFSPNLIKQRFAFLRYRLPKPISAILCRNFGFYCSQTLLLFDFQSFEFERTWWWLFQKRVVWTKFDIYVFITPN